MYVKQGLSDSDKTLSTETPRHWPTGWVTAVKCVWR